MEYGEPEYTQRKAALETAYSWLNEEILGEEEGVSPEFAYIYFYDRDLDFIGPDMPGFLLKETGWSKVAGK